MKTKVQIVVLFLLFVFPLQIFCQEAWVEALKNKSWLSPLNQLVLQESDKAEVESILGKPERFEYPTADFIEYYNVPNGRVTATFSTTPCQTLDGRSVRAYTLEEVDLELAKHRSFSSLNLRTERFILTHDNDAPVVKTYTDVENGLAIEVQSGIVTSVNFSIPQNRRCLP